MMPMVEPWSWRPIRATGDAAGAVGADRGGDAAREIDHHADAEFGDGSGKAGRRARHQDAVPARGLDIDIADVDGAAQEGDETLRRLVEEAGGSGRHAVRDDDGAARGMDRQGVGAKMLAGRVDYHLRDVAERGHGARAVIIRQHIGGVAEKDATFGHVSALALPVCEEASRASISTCTFRASRPLT